MEVNLACSLLIERRDFAVFLLRRCFRLVTQNVGICMYNFRRECMRCMGRFERPLTCRGQEQEGEEAIPAADLDVVANIVKDSL
jgi:hypothetical protein